LILYDVVLEKEFDWKKMEDYLRRFNVKTLDKKIKLIQKVYEI